MLDRIVVREIISVLMGSSFYLGLTVPERLKIVKHLLHLMSVADGARFQAPGPRSRVPAAGSRMSGNDGRS